MQEKMYLWAFDSAEKLLHERYIPIYNWYEDLHFLLDDEDSKRVYYRVRSIVGEEINADGIVVAKFRNIYSEQGALAACYTWQNDQWVDVCLDLPQVKEAHDEGSAFK